jgi:hypothetical protein
MEGFMKKIVLCGKGFTLFGALLFLMLFIFGCSSSSSTPPPPAVQLLNLSDFQDASVVIGQADFTAANINQGGSVGANTIQYPFGNPLVNNGILYLPDSENNRVLGFNTIPTSNDAEADFVLGQLNLTSNSPGTAANEMDYPTTVKTYNGKLFVTDFHNSRVLIWNTVPTTSGTNADVVVGQTGFGLKVATVSQSGLNEPYSIEVAGGKLIVTDSGNNRILIWNTIPTTNGANADVVLGQDDFTHNARNDDNQDGTPDSTPSARTLYKPAGVWSDGTRLVVVDYNNNRVLIWNTFPTANFQPADVVLGQSDFTHNAANDGSSKPTAQTLYWPFGLDSNGVQLVVTDSLNNRVLIWNTFPTTNYQAADLILGQGDATHMTYNDDNQDGTPDSTPSVRTLYEPSGVYIYGTKLFVGDYSNHRYLIFE